ncbi:ORF6N domain-containing protein, partial [Aliarcobacter butzleri]
MEDYYFELTDIECENLRTKILTANFTKVRIKPKVFTEQGIYMLETILKSKVDSQVTVYIIKTLVNMRKL